MQPTKTLFLLVKRPTLLLLFATAAVYVFAQFKAGRIARPEVQYAQMLEDLVTGVDFRRELVTDPVLQRIARFMQNSTSVLVVDSCDYTSTSALLSSGSSKLANTPSVVFGKSFDWARSCRDQPVVHAGEPLRPERLDTRAHFAGHGVVLVDVAADDLASETRPEHTPYLACE
eukprot:TRINITY_DN27911_c0_g1_i1.p1 TRINITY_DN27911_c0_g1~~TRINITY_DN27911_c0_g1_i1.p1  ORF type:complete len:181 (+),score=3.63 TRINITY_DN27911_c0_g1_i1:27-545(+)